MQQFHLHDDESLNPGNEAQAIAHIQDEEALKHERVTEEEAQQIVHLWAENQRESQSGGPTVKDIAEGLEIPTHEARRLLQQVRDQRKQVVRPALQHQTRLPLVVAAFVMFLIAIVLASALFMVRSSTDASAPATAVIESPQPTPPPSLTPTVSPPVEAPAPARSKTYGGPPD
jgi:hypothetical protein